MAIDSPGGDRWRTPFMGAGQHRRNFLASRGMAALPTGEESCDDAVAPKRSRRRRPSGRSAHHQRPLDAGWNSEPTEIKATLKAPQGKQVRHHRRSIHLLASQAGSRPMPCPTDSRHPTTPPHGQVGHRDCLQETTSERELGLGEVAGHSGPTRSVHSANLDGDQAKALPRYPCPNSSRFNDRLTKTRRSPRPRQVQLSLNETRTSTIIVQHVVR